MKILLLYIASFFSLSALIAQEKNIQIDWVDNQTLAEDGFYTEVPLARNLGFDIDVSGRFQFVMTWNSDGIDFSDAQISNIVVENIDVAKLININKNSIPSEVDFSVTQTLARGNSFENLKFTPIIKEGGVYKKVLSFKLKSVNETSNNLSTSSKALKANIVTSSVLASGDWYKFKIDTTGIYKITPEFLSSIGMNLNGVDAGTIKIYGNGGKSLPLANDQNEIFDVPENPIKIIGAEDNVFSGDDYILFYGRGSQGYVAENRSPINPYDDNAYYYVTAGGNQSVNRIVGMIEPSGTPTQFFDTYDYYSFYERDLFNLGQLGRVWHGDKFGSLDEQRDYVFDFPELKLDSEVKISAVFSAIYGLEPELSMTVTDNTGVNPVVRVAFGSLNTGNNAYSNRTLSTVIENTSSNIIGDNLSINLNYLKGADASSEGYLDYITLSTECILKGAGKQFGFSNVETVAASGIGQFQLSNASSLSGVWDVTNPYKITEKLNSGNSELTLNFNLGELKTYVALDDNDLYLPTALSNAKLVNQNLKGSIFQNQSNQFQNIDYLIITTSEFIDAASELASFRTQNDGFNVKVVDVDLIYNEFSTGKKDIGAIRNFVRYVYENANSDDERLKYLCIIGDGSYDYKNRISNNVNHVPLYHAIESSSLPSSFVSDDFYTLMDIDEGGDLGNDKMDLSVGRIPVRNLNEAHVMVDKIISYYEKEAFGDWRNSVLFVSDDVDDDLDIPIQEKIIEISDKMESEIPRVNVKRILTDSYVQETTSGGSRYSKANADLMDAFELGMSYINYFGHGGEDGITGEFIFSSESARALTNQQRLTVFTTLTCELTRFDNPNRLTAGEYLYWNTIGGAVALLTTTRNLFLTTGLDLNDSLSDALFDENNLTVAIGDAVRLAKNSIGGVNKRAVFCIGDPALKIAIPKTEIKLTSVNGMAITDWNLSKEPLKALDRVTVKGKLVDGLSNADITDYKGQVTISLFDKIRQRTTLGNDGTTDSAGDLVKVNYTEIGNLIFKGLASVNEGLFSLDFVLPKNVVLAEGEGKISMYAEDNQDFDDQSGTENLIIGGLNANAVEDVVPPLITLFMNDENFIPGQLVSSSPSILAKFSDDNGINTAGGVGHDIIAILDGDEANPIVLNEYYVTNLDDFTNGKLIYKLNNLEPGEHRLEVRVSDTYNNSSRAEVLFIVGESSDFELSNVLNYPNPFVSYTEFWFSHSSISNDTLEISVQVMTVTGKIVTTKFATLSGKSSYRSAISWDGRDDFGNKIGKGVYVYKITAKSTLTNRTTFKFEKLVVL